MPDFPTILGVTAALCTTAAHAPQVIKVWKTRSAEDLSLKMLGILAVGLLLWALYGWIIEDWVVLVANLASVSMTLYLLGFKYLSEGRGGRE